MKILYYAPNPNLSLNAQTGYGTHMREIINCWKQTGHEVQTLVAGDLNNSVSPSENLSTPSIKRVLKSFIPSYLWETLKDRELINFDLKLARVLSRHIESFQPDLIYERVSYLQQSGVEVAERLSVKHVAEVNAPFPEERIYFSGKSAYLKKAEAVERKILEKSSCISVVSSAIQSYLVEKVPAAAEKIHVIPNAVNSSQTKLDIDKVKKLKSKYNPTDALVFGFVGSIFPYHGVDLLLAGFHKTPGNSILIIVGDGASIPQLKNYVNEHGLENRVFFTGSVPHTDVFHLIQLMDICCMMNSNWYGSPVKLFEYGLMKKAVVAPNVAPVRDVMIHEEDGILVSNSIDEISRAFKRLISDFEFRSQIAESWNKKVIENYTWEKVAQKTLTLCT